MARQPYLVNTSVKQMEVFNDFSGGIITMEHPSKIADNAFQLMENVDLVAGGAVIQRGAYKKIADGGGSITGVSQGLFNYENLTGGLTLEAVGGYLYKVINGVYSLLNIVNLTSFQTTRPIEAVQVGNMMYIATGSGLVQFDGTTASLVTPYTPNADEALHTGLNALATDPESYIVDNNSAASNDIVGLKCQYRYGLTNHYTAITAYVDKIATDTLEYRFSTKLTTDTKYVMNQDWSTNKVFNHKYTKKADYSIMCEMRKQGTTAILDTYVLSKFRILSVSDPHPAPTINGADLNKCNRILFQYNRIWMYGDTGNPNNLYISQLNNFAYYPRTFTISIHDTYRGSLQSIVKYRGYAVAFTNHGVHMIEGQSPSDYVVTPIHTVIGTLYPYSVQVIGNTIAFVGNDNRIYNLVPTYRTISAAVMMVQSLDDKIREGRTSSISGTMYFISQANKILSCVYNNQYYLYLGGIAGNNYIYRYHFDTGVWTRDNVAQAMSQITVIYNTLLTSSDINGRVYQLSKGVYLDDVNTTFTVTIITKDYDYGMPYHKKKLKQAQLIAKTKSDVTITLNLYGDDVQLNPTNNTAVGDPTKNSNDSQKFLLPASGRFRYIRGVLTFPVTDDVTLLGLGFVFKQSSPK